MIHIYDGMAVLRRRFDGNMLNSGPRSVFGDMLELPRSDVAIWCFEGRGSSTPAGRSSPATRCVRPQ
ncbi:hypothetical protein ACFQWF_01465 [Methylorubrum suomiense]